MVKFQIPNSKSQTPACRQAGIPNSKFQTNFEIPNEFKFEFGGAKLNLFVEK